jgi:CrcB protein
MTDVVLVGAAGAAGAVARHLLDVGLHRRTGTGPSYGVLVANVVGSFILGTLLGWSTSNIVDPQVRLALGTGFCGAFTTFSTLMAELVSMLEGEGDGQGAGPAIAWGLVSVVGGVGAAAIGWTLGGGW